MKLKFLSILLVGTFAFGCTAPELEESNEPLQEEVDPIPPLPPPSPCYLCL